MKKRQFTIWMIVMLMVAVLSQLSAQVGEAQTAVARPVVMISSYAASSTPARGENFSLSVLFHNSGQEHARNIFIEFVSAELLPRENGGSQSLYQLNTGETKGISQPFTVSPELWGATVASVTVNVEYSDPAGTSYTDSFTLVVSLGAPRYVAPAPTGTPTAIEVFQPQLVISNYATDVDVLQPGSAFELKLDVANLGNADAKAVSMVLGGGDVEINPEGTPQPGISGGGGEFTNFAPLESSNVQFIGDVKAGESVSASQKIIVNVTTSPGAYSLKFSFIYTTATGMKVVDNQVITLLVIRIPALEVGFYQDPGPIFTNQPNNLPLQVMNLGKQSVVLGNMTVTAPEATVENNKALVGPIEAGFYFTLDAMLMPLNPGSQDVLISISYTDDFNQPRVFETTLTVDVQDGGMFPEEPGYPNGDPGFPDDGGFPPDMDPFPVTETFWQKVGRFFRGLFGLGSEVNTPDWESGPVDFQEGEGGPSIPPTKGR